MVQESGRCLAGDSCLKVFHKVAVKMSARTAVISRLKFRRLCFLGFLVPHGLLDRGPYFLPGWGWRFPSVPCHVDFSIGYATTWQLASLRESHRHSLMTLLWIFSRKIGAGGRFSYNCFPHQNLPACSYQCSHSILLFSNHGWVLCVPISSEPFLMCFESHPL